MQMSTSMFSPSTDPRLAASFRPVSKAGGDDVQSPADLAAITRQNDFAGVLSRESGEKGTPQQQARQAAEDFISVAFVQPILKQLRETNNAAPPFAPGPGEKQFKALADAHTARQMVRASNWPLVQRLEQQMLRTTDRVLPASPADLRRREEARLAEVTNPSPAPAGLEGTR